MNFLASLISSLSHLMLFEEIKKQLAPLLTC